MDSPLMSRFLSEAGEMEREMALQILNMHIFFLKGKISKLAGKEEKTATYK